MKRQTVEKKVADTLLQKPTTIEIGGKTYEAAPPSIATLALVSGLISLLPDKKSDGNNIVQESLAMGEHGETLAEIAAVLVLGARKVTSCKKAAESARKWRFLRVLCGLGSKRTELELLKQEIFETMSPSKLQTLIATLLQKLDLGDFFALTTFLSEANMLKMTKVD